MRTLLLAACVVCTGAAAQSEQKPQPQRSLQAEGGRFVFGQISEYRRDQYLLDTKTGRLWYLTASVDDKGEVVSKVLEPVGFRGPADGKVYTEPK